MRSNITLFGQILQWIPRYEFQKAVREHETEKYSKGFSSWTHFVSMLFCQLSNLDSLRAIVNGINSQANKLYHLGVQKISRATLSYANSNRSHKLFSAIFHYLLNKTIPIAPKHKFRFKNPLYSLDSTTIDLCLSLFDWAKFRKTKGGVKLHVKLSHSGYLPTFAVLGSARSHDRSALHAFKFKKGDVVVFDRGYNDYQIYANHCSSGVYFVTRLKKNAQFRIVERRSVKKYKNILSDHIIEFTGYYSQKKCPLRLRKITARDPETGKTIVILTNQFEWSAQTIAAVYKDRWQIEIFFKAMKQRLKIKSFVGTSRNALLTQITSALIAYLLLSYMKFLSKSRWTVWNLTAVIPTLLFSTKDLLLWLQDPFNLKESETYSSLQLELI